MPEEIARPFKSVTMYDRLVAFRHWLTSLTHREKTPPRLRQQLGLEQAEDRTVPSITLTAYLMSGSITAGGSTGVTGSVSTGTGMSSLVVTYDWNAVHFDGWHSPRKVNTKLTVVGVTQ